MQSYQYIGRKNPPHCVGPPPCAGATFLLAYILIALSGIYEKFLASKEVCLAFQ